MRRENAIPQNRQTYPASGSKIAKGASVRLRECHLAAERAAPLRCSRGSTPLFPAYDHDPFECTFRASASGAVFDLGRPKPTPAHPPGAALGITSQETVAPFPPPAIGEVRFTALHRAKEHGVREREQQFLTETRVKVGE